MQTFNVQYIKDSIPVFIRWMGSWQMIAGAWLVNLSRGAVMVTSAQWLLLGNLLWFTIGVVSVALTFVPQILIRNRQLLMATKVYVALFLAAHVILGMHFGWYETSAVYDKWIHLLGSSVLTGLVMVAIIQYCRRIKLTLPLALLFTLVLGIAISAGTLWEIFEFIVDRTGLFQAQRGLSDTMLDLIADTVGALAMLGLYAGFDRYRTRALCETYSRD